MSGPVTITAALTGGSATKSDHPGLPVTVEEIARSALEAHTAGASVVHLHVRGEDGRPSADVDIARRLIARVSEVCPALIQLSTGVGPDVPFEARAALVEARPTMASLNVATMSFPGGEFHNPPAGVRRLAARMRELGVKPELEIYDTGHLQIALGLLEDDLLATPVQFSIVLGVFGGMPADPRALLSLVAQLPEGAVWQAVAIGRHNLPLTAVGLAAGGNARTGLEDTLKVRRGQLAASNAELVTRTAALAAALDRRVAGVDETSQRLGLRHEVGA